MTREDAKEQYMVLMGLKAYLRLTPCPEGIDETAWSEILHIARCGLSADARALRSWFAPVPAKKTTSEGFEKEREVVITDKAKVEKWVEQHRNLFAAAIAFRDFATAEADASTGVLADVWRVQAAYAEAHAENCADMWGRAVHTGQYSYWTRKPLAAKTKRCNADMAVVGGKMPPVHFNPGP